MRALVVIAVAAGCHTFDPVAEVPHGHREVADTAAAIQLILAENPEPKVFAIGEYHPTRATAAGTTPMARFTREIIGLLEPHAKHLVVETWPSDRCHPDAAAFQAALDRPSATQMELLHLRATSQQLALDVHDLPMTCLEQDVLLDVHKGINYLLLLEVVTQKLQETTERVLAADPDHAVIVYGGELHNDLYPRWPLDELSYALPLERAHGEGSVLEIDLVVPEIVASLRLVRGEPWYALLARASPSRAIVWQRGPSSYVVILPAQSEAVAKAAQVM